MGAALAAHLPGRAWGLPSRSGARELLEGLSQRVDGDYANTGLVCPLGQIGRTPLHLVAEKGHADVARLLLDRGAQLEAVEKVWVRSLPTTCLAGLGAAPEVRGT